jgi:hypothetical protein
MAMYLGSACWGPLRLLYIYFTDRGRIGVAAVVAALSAAVVDPPYSLHYLHRITSNYVQLVPACPLFCYRFSFKLSLLLFCLR